MLMYSAFHLSLVPLALCDLESMALFITLLLPLCTVAYINIAHHRPTSLSGQGNFIYHYYFGIPCRFIILLFQKDCTVTSVHLKV